MTPTATPPTEITVIREINVCRRRDLEIAQAHCEFVGHSGELWYSAALHGGTVRHEVPLNECI